MNETIEPFINRKTVVLHEDETAEHAARAMCENRVGSIIVSDHEGHITGIVTDRDLTCELIANNLSPDTPIRELMTMQVIGVPKHASLSDVIELMQINGIRRVPIIHETKKHRQKCVGMVTLDDLLAARMIEPDDITKIIKSQIIRRSRYLSRVVQKATVPSASSFNEFLESLEREMAINKEKALEVAEYVLGSITMRLHYTGATHFIAQLPREFQRELIDLPPGPERSITGKTLALGVALRLGVSDKAALDALRRFWRVLKRFTVADQMAHVVDQLPADIRGLLEGPEAKPIRGRQHQPHEPMDVGSDHMSF